MSKVFAYIIEHELPDEALERLTTDGKEFVGQWTAHSHQLAATFEIFRKRIILIRVDESGYGASGCSVDALMRFIREMEKKYGTTLLNRMLFCYKLDNSVFVSPASGTEVLLKKGVITENSIIYNTAVSNEEELRNWEQPLKDTWLKKFLQKA
jgi:hypothetical protein